MVVAAVVIPDNHVYYPSYGSITTVTAINSIMCGVMSG
jgi:hypothetical protein